MISTIREKLIDRLNARVAAISSVGGVVEAGAVDPTEFTPALAQGKYVVETLSTDDEVAEPPFQFETFLFYFIAIANCPEITGRSKASIAADIHGEIYKALCGTAAVPNPGGGPNLPANTIDGLAIDCTIVGGGAAAIDPDTRNVQTYTAVMVKYRHLVGDPTQ